MQYAEVIGSPIAHSKSPLIHQFWLERLGLAASYRATEIRPTEFQTYLAERRGDRSWSGCNVTMPLKSLAASLVDHLSPAARKTGAVNLIVRRRQHLIGHNVDREGFLESIRAPAERRGIRRAMVVGSGGAAAAIIHGIHGRGFRTDALARDCAKARALLRAMGASRGLAMPLEHGLPTPREPLLLVNATPLGMRGFPELGLDLQRLPAGSLVCDIVYDPVETGLIRAARQQGLEAVNGLHMLVGQAALSFELLFRTAPPRSCDRDLLGLLAQ